MAAVIALLAVAVAGLVIAHRQRTAPDVATQVASQPISPPAASAPAASAPSVTAAATATDVVFAAGLDQLPANADATVVAWVSRAREEGKMLRMTARYETGPNREADRQRAKSRTENMRRAAQAAGLAGDKTQIELVEFAQGSMPPRDRERVEFSLR